MKKKYKMFFCIIVCCTLFGCSAKNIDTSSQNKLGEGVTLPSLGAYISGVKDKINNIDPVNIASININNVNTIKDYMESDIINAGSYALPKTISDVDDNFGIEKIRSSGKWIYSVSVLKDDENQLAFLFVLYNTEDSQDGSVLDSWVVNKLRTKSDFDSLTLQVSTLEDVKKIDSVTVFSQWALNDFKKKGSSKHLLSDGTILNISYTIKNNVATVEEINCYENKWNFIDIVLPIDKELIT